MDHYLFPILAFVTGVILCLIGIPYIIRIADEKHLFDEPGERAMHKKNIPTLGGIAIFASCLVAFMFWLTVWPEIPKLEEASKEEFRETALRLESLVKWIKILGAAAIITFFSGITDDIVDLPPIKKFLAQILTAAILAFSANILISDMYGILGLSIPLTGAWGYPLTIFTMLLIINGFNLIDGLDGLAGGLGVISAVAFGVLFIYLEDIPRAVLAFALAGSLVGFLRYNLPPARIFMGDTGSLFVGVIMAVLAIDFIEAVKGHDQIPKGHGPVIAFAILMVPLFDTLRVFTLRVLKGRSPFFPDQNHIHHLLVNKNKMSHKKAILILYFVSILFCTLPFFLLDLNANFALAILLVLALVLSQLPIWFHKKTPTEPSK